MDAMLCAYRGCVLGMAVGDAMGYTIDDKSWEQIQENYGPNGLLGFDLQAQEYAQITSYTQLAAYLCNGLLLGLSRSKHDYMLYCRQALREWTRSQQFHRDPESSLCWLAKLPQFRRRQCRDARMLDHLRLEFFGTMDNPRNSNAAPGALTEAVATGLFYQPRRIPAEQVGSMAAELIALTHGSPETFLSGAVLSYVIAGILQEPEHPLEDQFLQAVDAMQAQFGEKFPQAEDLGRHLREVISIALQGEIAPQEGMEKLHCLDADQCLAGAMFACLVSPEDFDRAVIIAVNHSGNSAAVGAITGAILGAKLGEYALPEFYLESLDCADALCQIAEDMLCGSPAMGIFDDSWDHKYVQGLPPEGINEG